MLPAAITPRARKFKILMVITIPSAKLCKNIPPYSSQQRKGILVEYLILGVLPANQTNDNFKYLWFYFIFLFFGIRRFLVAHSPGQ